MVHSVREQSRGPYKMGSYLSVGPILKFGEIIRRDLIPDGGEVLMTGRAGLSVPLEEGHQITQATEIHPTDDEQVPFCILSNL